MKRKLEIISSSILLIFSLILFLEDFKIGKINDQTFDQIKDDILNIFFTFGLLIFSINLINLFEVFFYKKDNKNKIIEIAILLMNITVFSLFIINSIKSDNVISKIIAVFISIFFMYQILYYFMNIFGYKKKS